MKKTVSLALALVMLVSTMLFATSCDLDGVTSLFEHPIDRLGKVIVEDSNYQVRMTYYNFPLVGTLSGTGIYDGNIHYISSTYWSEEYYIETVGDTIYKYQKNEDGVLEKTVEENEEVVFYDDIFQSECYEKIGKNVYKQKKDVKFELIGDVVLTIDDDECTVEGYLLNDDGTVGGIGIKLVFSKMGEIELTLPEVD